MPISSLGDYSAEHWAEVREILDKAINKSGFESQLVSEANETSIIHQRIVQNIIDNKIVVCDVSGKNPNVMFELGMRLAFDKATIVIKDDVTDYSFDTSPIEHLIYPRSLRHKPMEEFKNQLSAKIRATVLASEKPEYSSFLKNFKRYEVKTIGTEDVTLQEVLMKKLQRLEELLVQSKPDVLVSGNRVMATFTTGRMLKESFSDCVPTVSDWCKMYLSYQECKPDLDVLYMAIRKKFGGSVPRQIINEFVQGYFESKQ